MGRAPFRHSIPLELYCFLVWPCGPRRSTHTVRFYLWLPKLQVAARRGRGDVTHRARENNGRSIPTTVRGTDEMGGLLPLSLARTHRRDGNDDSRRIAGKLIRCATDDVDAERVTSVMIIEISELLAARLPRCTNKIAKPWLSVD